MRTIDTLLRHFAEPLRAVHGARMRLVLTAVCALLRADRASLTAIGRAIAERTSQKHGIKRVDRLLGNRALWHERFEFYRAIAQRLLAPSSRPVIAVDWTSFTTTMWTLSAAVPIEGRAVVIYSESHPISEYLKPPVNKRFLRNLRKVLPTGCRPIVVTDAGFRTPWMKEVVALGWDYICRLRGLNRLRPVGKSTFIPMSDLFSLRSRCSRDFGFFQVGLRARYLTRLVGFKRGKTSKRKAMSWLEKWGKLPKTGTTKQRRAAHEPWILATSLECSPLKIVAHYRRRMQIEETFRDTKSSRFGLSMAEARSRVPRRADLLNMLANLAHLVSLLAGLVAESGDFARRFQANTLRTRRVFSLSRLGRLVLASDDVPPLSLTGLRAAWSALTQRLQPVLAEP